MIVVKVRLTCETEEEAATARRYLERRLQNLLLAAPREGTNPRYTGDQKVFVYGDILVPQGKEHVPKRARRTSRASVKPAKPAKPAKPETTRATERVSLTRFKVKP